MAIAPSRALTGAEGLRADSHGIATSRSEALEMANLDEVDEDAPYHVMPCHDNARGGREWERERECALPPLLAACPDHSSLIPQHPSFQQHADCLRLVALIQLVVNWTILPRRGVVLYGGNAR